MKCQYCKKTIKRMAHNQKGCLQCKANAKNELRRQRSKYLKEQVKYCVQHELPLTHIKCKSQKDHIIVRQEYKRLAKIL